MEEMLNGENMNTITTRRGVNPETFAPEHHILITLPIVSGVSNIGRTAWIIEQIKLLDLDWTINEFS